MAEGVLIDACSDELIEKDAILLAEDLRKLIENNNFDLNHSVTISGGVSHARESDHVSSWIERCDKALYQAKAENRNKVLLG